MNALARAVLEAFAADDVARGELRMLLDLGESVPQEPDRWIGAREAAAHLGITSQALYKLTAARELPFVQDCRGGKLWFKRSELDEWRQRGSHRDSCSSGIGG